MSVLYHDPYTGCAGCPLHDGDRQECQATEDLKRASLALSRAPEWCPLYTGMVTVRCSKLSEGDDR